MQSIILLFSTCTLLVACVSDKHSDRPGETSTRSKTQEATKPAPTSDYTPFTVDEFLEKADMLQPMESLGNFEKTTRFACDFLHGDNVVTGEFRKSDRKLSHLVIVGSGEDWRRAELIAVSLASKSESGTESLLAKIEAQGSAIINGVSFEQRDTLGKKMLYVKSTSFKPETAKEQEENKYVPPTVALTIPAFKKSFNRIISATNKKLVMRGNGEETTSPSYFSYNFSNDTNLNVYGNDKFVIENIELDGQKKEPQLFWTTARATIAALNPTFSELETGEVLAKLGYSDSNDLTSNSAAFDYKGKHYEYMLGDAGCAISIGSDQP